MARVLFVYLLLCASCLADDIVITQKLGGQFRTCFGSPDDRKRLTIYDCEIALPNGRFIVGHGWTTEIEGQFLHAANGKQQAFDNAMAKYEKWKKQQLEKSKEFK